MPKHWKSILVNYKNHRGNLCSDPKQAYLSTNQQTLNKPLSAKHKGKKNIIMGIWASDKAEIG